VDQSEKSPEAFRTISEVSEVLDVPQHVLRFWEGKFSQIKPMKRGGNRRYYRPEDVDLLHAISHLLYTDGYTIKGVQKLLRENGVRATVSAYMAAQNGEVPLDLDRPEEPAVPAVDAIVSPSASAVGEATESAPQSPAFDTASVIAELRSIQALLNS